MLTIRHSEMSEREANHSPTHVAKNYKSWSFTSSPLHINNLVDRQTNVTFIITKMNILMQRL